MTEILDPAEREKIVKEVLAELEQQTDSLYEMLWKGIQRTQEKWWERLDGQGS